MPRKRVLPVHRGAARARGGEACRIRQGGLGRGGPLRTPFRSRIRRGARSASDVVLWHRLLHNSPAS